MDVTRCPRDGQPLVYTVERPAPSIAMTKATCTHCGGGFNSHTIATSDTDDTLFFDDGYLIGELQRRMLDGVFDGDPLREWLKTLTKAGA